MQHEQSTIIQAMTIRELGDYAAGREVMPSELLGKSWPRLAASERRA